MAKSPRITGLRLGTNVFNDVELVHFAAPHGVFSFVLLVMLAAACRTASDRPPQPMRPPSSAELAMGYHEAIDLGSRYVADYGYTGAELHGADQPFPNIWRVRFGVVPDGSKKVLELYFDGNKKTLIKAEELEGIKGKLGPDQLAPTPQRQ